MYRFATSDDDWQFTGGIFVNFDTRENAEEFLKLFSETKLSYNGDGKPLLLCLNIQNCTVGRASVRTGATGA